MNLREEAAKLTEEGYSQANARARLCQDIILNAISNSTLNRNVTIKGGVVMRSLSDTARRATQDVDLDFIKYSIDNDSIRSFVNRLNNASDLTIEMSDEIEELNHQDYKGKRISIIISDDNGNHFKSKVDLGVHKNLDIKQEDYCFDICYSDDSASLLINSPAQMLTEKLKSLLRFEARSTRYKDIFDIVYLLEKAEKSEIDKCLETYIFRDNTLDVNNKHDIVTRLERTFNNDDFMKELEDSKRNWMDLNPKVAAEIIVKAFQ